MRLRDLHLLPDGTVWSIPLAEIIPEPPPTLDRLIYWFQRAINQAVRRLRGELVLNDATEQQAEVVRNLLVELLRDELVAVAALGTLTRLDRGNARPPAPASLEFLITGPVLDGAWIPRPQGAASRLVVSLVVRTYGNVPPELELRDGVAYIAVTITEKSQAWVDILGGSAMTEDLETHHIEAGQHFIPEEHCDYVRNPPHELFGSRASVG